MDTSAEAKGWRTSLSHPSKVAFEPLEDGTQILATGIDTLIIGIDVKWKTDDFFEYLGKQKELAKNEDKEIQVELSDSRKVDSWAGAIMPYGMRGYEWILVGKEYSFHIGSWPEPTTKPSMIVEIRSETLWHIGADEAVRRVISFIDGAGGHIVKIKASRADVCVDVLLPSPTWTPALLDYTCTRAVKDTVYRSHKMLEGIVIGAGIIQARLYDKPLEIKQKGQKEWMFDVWGIEESTKAAQVLKEGKDLKTEDCLPLHEVPEGFNIIRVEFQLRREALRELGIDTASDLLTSLPNLWAYLSDDWLKFQTNPGQHHTQRETFPWWDYIQKAFTVDQGTSQEAPKPLIRCKAICTEEKKHFAQAYGCFTSLLAATVDLEAFHKENDIKDRPKAGFYGGLNKFRDLADVLDKTEGQFWEDLEKKKYKIDRAIEKINETVGLRLRLGLPNNLEFI